MPGFRSYNPAGPVQRLEYKPAVRAATTANITLSGLQTIDDIALAAQDRILVKNQTTGSQNGLYLVQTGAWARTVDADGDQEVGAGLIVHVDQGTANLDSWWYLSTNDPITVGTTALTFVQLPSAIAVGGAPTTIEPDDVAATGVSASAARQDHRHGIVAALAGAIAVGDAAGEGVSTSFARADHVHGLSAPAAPADVTKDTASAGVATTVARADHKHDVSTGAPGAIAPDDTALEGTATSLARSDHRHEIATAIAGSIAVGDAAGEGLATSFARSDHTHGLSAPAAPVDVTKDTASAGLATTVARADHKHDVTTAAPVTIGTSNSEGIATTLARSDHLHDVGTVAAANGGTGLTSYAIGDLLYASAATTLASLADIATGNALLSGGVGAAPAWGKVGLATHITDTLAVGNGGTGAIDAAGARANLSAAELGANTDITSMTGLTGAVRWASGAAVTAAAYEIIRDADGTNQLHLNVPTGASFEFSVNDVAGMTQSGTAISLNPGGIDIDTTIASDNNASMFVIDAALDKMGLGAAVGAENRLNIAFPTLTITAAADGAWASISPALTEAGSLTHVQMRGVYVGTLNLTSGVGATTVATTFQVAGPPSGTGIAANAVGFLVGDLVTNPTSAVTTAGEVATAVITPTDLAAGVAATAKHTYLLIGGNNALLSDQTATTDEFASLYIEQPQLQSVTLVRTVTQASTIYIGGPPLANSNITFTNPALALFVDEGPVRFDDHLSWGAGVAVTATQYSVGRDADGTNQLHLNVPTGASFEFSVNDVAELVLNLTNLQPGANDGLALGVSGTAFSDLFLASGAVIDFAGGDVTVTHSANTLAFAGATSGYSFDTMLDLSGIGAGSTNLKITATSDVPVVTWGGGAGNEVSTTPAGYIEVDVGGSPRYVPFWA